MNFLSQSIARIEMAQVCESIGFQGFQKSTLDTFSDVASKNIPMIYGRHQTSMLI